MTEGPPSNHALSPGHDIGQSLWQSCVDQLAQELPEQQFNTWIKPLSAQVLEDFSKVTIFGPSPIQRTNFGHAGENVRAARSR